MYYSAATRIDFIDRKPSESIEEIIIVIGQIHSNYNFYSEMRAPSIFV